MSPNKRRKVVVAFAQTLQHKWDDPVRSLGSSRLQIELVTVESSGSPSLRKSHLYIYNIQLQIGICIGGTQLSSQHKTARACARSGCVRIGRDKMLCDDIRKIARKKS
jgi:hypothetical protein